MATANATLVVDPEFKAQHRILTPEERTHLESLLCEQGCLDALKVWDSDDGLTIVDGHNRYEICCDFDIPYKLDYLEFDDREAAAEWIDRWQLGQRNLSPDDFKITSGRIYNRRKKRAGAQEGNANASKQLDQIDPVVSTAAEVAEELGTSEPTIKRNGQRAEVYDSILATGDAEGAQAAKEAPQKDIAAVKDKPPEQAAAELKARKAVHVSQNTGMPEWYTPSDYIEAARAVMGVIELDPASSDIAQQRVRADAYYTVDDNGLEAEWSGSVWMNPPYTAGLVDRFCDKLIQHYNDEEVSEAIVLVNNATDTKWFQRLAEVADSLCFPLGRIKFLDTEGNPKGAPLQGQCVFYLGGMTKLFHQHFSQFGLVVEVRV